MPVLVSELLEEPSLRLRALTSHGHADTCAITWVANTELTDPAPFLRGGELVCTTALQERTDAQWRRFVDQLVGVPVAALCIGTGLVRDSAPGALLTAAEDAKLIVLNSPVSVPFIQVSRWVADRIFAERYDLIRSSAIAQDELLRELLGGSNLPRLVRTLGRHLGPDAQIALVDTDNRAIAAHPSGVDWSGGPEPAEVPILVEGKPLAYLRCRATAPRLDILSSVASVLGLEIARRHAVLAGRRALAGQVLEDVVERTGSESEARRRLGELGLSCADAHRVIIGQARDAAASLRSNPTAINRLFDSTGDGHLTATIGENIVIVVSARTEVSEVTNRLLSTLRGRDARAAVAIGSAHPDVSGIRSSYPVRLRL